MKAALLFLLGITLFFGVVRADPPPSPNFYIAPNLVTPGVAFDIVAKLQADKSYDFCEYLFPEVFKVFLDPAKATFGDDDTKITRVVLFACPSDQTSLNIPFNCTKKGEQDSVEYYAPGKRAVQLLPGPKLDGTLQVTTTADKKSTATLVLQSVASVNSITGVKCTFSGSPKEVSFENININSKLGNCDATKQCTVGDIMGDASVTLQAGVTGATLDGKSNVTVTCSGMFGPLQCPYIDLTAAVPPPPPEPLKLATKPVIAGENTDITVTMASVPDGTACTLTLPPEKFHLNTANTGCVQVSGSKTVYNCTDLKKSPTLQVHVDSSATASDSTTPVALKCGSATASANFSVKSEATVQAVNLRLLRVGTQGLNISLSINSTGPSDLKDLSCSLSYPFDIGQLPKSQYKCTSAGDDWTCTRPFNVPGKDANENLPLFVFNVTFYLPKADYFAVARIFNFSCQEANTGVVIKPGDEIEWVNKDEVITKPSDSYFWTYTIVIINLFLIALVVFVGMWWRNRAIAKTLSEPRADRFTELELFSAPTTDGRLPLSKKD